MMHHEEQGHIGTFQILAPFNKEYWIINGRSVVNRVINNCMNCRFRKAKPKTQQIGDLPFHRVNKSSLNKSIRTDLMRLKETVCKDMSAFLFFWQPEQCILKFSVNGSQRFIQAYRRFCY